MPAADSESSMQVACDVTVVHCLCNFPFLQSIFSVFLLPFPTTSGLVTAHLIWTYFQGFFVITATFKSQSTFGLPVAYYNCYGSPPQCNTGCFSYSHQFRSLEVLYLKSAQYFKIRNCLLFNRKDSWMQEIKVLYLCNYTHTNTIFSVLKNYYH